MTPQLLAAFRDAPGFMPEDEGLALYDAAVTAAPLGPLVEIGTYCGRSTILLAAAAADAGTHVITIDHHRGSEEHQPGWEYHDPALVDPAVGRIDTLPVFRRTIERTGLEPAVIAVVGASAAVARYWDRPVGLVFIDGSHTEEAAQTDYASWSPYVARDGLLVIHDVFEDPAEGGQAPFHVYERAISSGGFVEVSRTGSLRVLRRVA